MNLLKAFKHDNIYRTKFILYIIFLTLFAYFIALNSDYWYCSYRFFNETHVYSISEIMQNSSIPEYYRGYEIFYESNITLLKAKNFSSF